MDTKGYAFVVNFLIKQETENAKRQSALLAQFFGDSYR